MNKDKFLDPMGRPLTQGMFLEIGYDEKYAIFTLKDDDFEYKGTLYPSLKKIYLKEEDPTEYEFATKHLLSWNQWKKVCANKILKAHIDEWREELEMKMKAQSVRDMQTLASSENGSYQATKYLAEKGWDKRQAGRPSKAEIQKHAAIEAHLDGEFSADIKRLEDFRK